MVTLPPPLRQWWLKFSSLAEPGDASLRAGISRPHRLDFNYSFVVTKRGLVLGSEEQTVGVQTLTSAAQSFLWSLAFAVVPRAPRCARRHRAGHGPRWHGLRGCSGTWSLLPPASVGNTRPSGTAVIQTRKGDLQIILQHSLKQLIS